MEHIISKTTRGGKILRIVLAALMCLSVFQVAALAAPQKAYAVTVPNIGDKAWGSCHIDDSWMSGSQSYFNTSGFSGDLAGAVAVGDIVCLDHTAAEPNHTDASYEATVSAVNVSAGWVEYSVYITPPGVTDGVTRDEFGRLTGYQHIGGTYRIEKDFVGWLDLDKDSADTSITDNNNCYSLSGAVYGIFASFADAQARTGAVGSLTTDANGYAKSGDLEPKTFYVREITPPQGYALDENIYSTTVAASSTVRVNGGKVLDTPQADPIGALLGKFDGEKTHDAANLPQGSASLALAQYEIKYYSGYHSTTDTSWTQSATPVRSWVMQTDEGGRVDLRAGDSTFVTKDGVSHPYKVSGDDFYRAAGAGIITMPLG
ncbi:MAG: prealbumin-like fold domain-containing protein, partial [Mucinivorans sp.]